MEAECDSANYLDIAALFEHELSSTVSSEAIPNTDPTLKERNNKKK